MELTQTQQDKLNRLTKLLNNDVSGMVWDETYYGEHFPETKSILSELMKEGVEFHFTITPVPYKVED